DRRAEDGEDTVAHQPGDGALVARDRVDHEADDAVHDLGPLFWIDLLGLCGGVDDVGEPDALQTSTRGARFRRGQRRAAVVAEARACRVLRVADGASHVLPPVREVLGTGVASAMGTASERDVEGGSSPSRHSLPVDRGGEWAPAWVVPR